MCINPQQKIVWTHPNTLFILSTFTKMECLPVWGNNNPFSHATAVTLGMVRLLYHFYSKISVQMLANDSFPVARLSHFFLFFLKHIPHHTTSKRHESWLKSKVFNRYHFGFDTSFLPELTQKPGRRQPQATFLKYLSVSLLNSVSTKWCSRDQVCHFNACHNITPEKGLLLACPSD